jgi:hypothetical protein
MKGACTGHYDIQYVRNMSCVGCILNKNTSSIWNWLEVGIHIFHSAVVPDLIFVFGNETGVTCKRQVGSMKCEEVLRDVLVKTKLERNVCEKG